MHGQKFKKEKGMEAALGGTIAGIGLLFTCTLNDPPMMF
jgi:hypothetical protein